MKQTPKRDSPEDRLKKCGEAIQKALAQYDCQMWPALKIGNAEAPLGEVAGFPVIVKLSAK